MASCKRRYAGQGMAKRGEALIAHGGWLARLCAGLVMSSGLALAQDGLVRVTPAIAPMLKTQRLGARPYSVSALQKFTTCPYQFVLSAIYRFAPNEAPVPLQRLDPLTRGSLFHEVQARVLRSLHADRRLPLTHESVSYALDTLAVAIEHLLFTGW